MPIYEYDCPKCGTFEVSHKMTDPSLETHEPCGERVHRRISLSSFLKGSSPCSSMRQALPSDDSPCGTGACNRSRECPAADA